MGIKMNPSNFRNKTVVVTGASAGVGAACARTFAALGAKLVLVARGREGLDAIEAELKKQTDVLTIAADVAGAGTCTQIVNQAIDRFGKIHVLINNAGLHYRGDVEHRAPEELAAMVDVNLRAPIKLTTAVLPHIRKAGSGSVVMVGSLAGRAPLQGAATYAATKAGLRAFTYSLADELRDSHITVGIVSPGPIDTGFIMDQIDEVEDIVYSQPMSTAQQVADAVVKIAAGKCVEIAIPWFSGKLTTAGYLSPAMRRVTRGFLSRKGRKNKEKYRRR